MNNILLLTKNYFKSFVGSLGKNSKNPKFYVGLLICGGLSIFITLTFTINSITTTQLFLEMAKEGVENAEMMAMYTNCTMAIIMLLFVTIMRSVIPSKSTDTDALLSLPFTKLEITVSKSLYNYLVDLVLFASILLPSFIVYCVLVTDASFLIAVRGTILLLFLPLVSNAIATFIGLLTNKIASKIKHYSIFQTIITIILIGFYLIANYSIQGYLNKITGTVDEIINKIFIIKVLLEYILLGKLGWFLIIAFAVVLIYTLSLLVLRNRLGKLEKRRSLNKQNLYFKQQNILKTLIQKELRQYFNIPMYILNTILPGVIYFGLCVAICVIGEDRALMFLNALPNIFKTNSDVLPIMLLSILLGSFVITGSAISLEGKTFWITISNPIKPIVIFASKIITNLILTGTIVVISFPFVLTFVDIEYAWIYLIVPFIGSVMSSTLGLFLNLNFPKMEWDKEEIVIKQSLSSMLALFLPIIFIIFPYMLYFSQLHKYYNIHTFMIFNILYLLVITLIIILWFVKKGRIALIKALNS